MTLGEATQMLKQGRRVRRPCWTGYVYLYAAPRSGSIQMTLAAGQMGWVPVLEDLEAGDYEEYAPFTKPMRFEQ
jgi:hypothetical protein